MGANGGRATKRPEPLVTCSSVEAVGNATEVVLTQGLLVGVEGAGSVSQ